jgi:DNA-binding Lrp family transcriptional regulator
VTESISEQDILQILDSDGPQTGAELAERTRTEPLPLWRVCRRSPEIHLEIVGRRYLRLDRAVEGYARLSPSIRREFLTYTFVGLAGNPEPTRQKAARLGEEIERISRYKYDLARDTMEEVVSQLPEGEAIRAAACFIIAGDVTYGMSHIVDRPEVSTGKMVHGSDLDIVVIATDDLPEDALESLDHAVYRRKSYLLFHPGYREEIDYIIKRLSKVHEQLRFDNLKSMIACKIMWEGQYLLGSRPLFDAVKALVDEHGIPARIAELEARATADRELAEAALLEPAADASDTESRHLFYTLEEGDEIA